MKQSDGLHNCIRRGLLLLLLLVIAGACVSCDSANGPSDEDSEEYLVYYLNRDETKLVSQEYYSSSTERDKLIEELLKELESEPKEKGLEPTIRKDVEVVNVMVEEDRLNIDFGEAYNNMEVATEILVRAGIVRTMTQIDGISIVSFSVNGISLTDASGQLVGLMKAENFIDNTGSEINAYEQAKLQLYFANESGTKLVPVTRTVMYNTNISMEKLVMEQLISGPVNNESYPTINPDTKIINVTVKDGICYVNLSGEFMTSVYTVNSEVTIYSIANTLTALSSVNKVKILVDGESNVIYREDTNLETVFSRNLDVIVNEEGE